MPLISDIDKSKKIKTLFQKKSYRPWDDEIPKSNNHIDSTNNQCLPHENKKDTNPTNVEFINNNIDQDTVLLDNTNTQFTTYLPELNLKKELRNLFGAQKTIIKYLLEQIEENSNDCLITKAISMDEFTLACKLLPNTTKGMLQKLKAKKLLYTYENKPGKGGYARYSFTKEVHSFLLKNLNNI